MIVKKIAQNYISKLSKAEILEYAVKTDSTSKTDAGLFPNESIHGGTGFESPTPKENYVHRSILIKKGAVNVQNQHHRHLVAQYHPWIKGYLDKVGKALWSQPPKFIKPGAENKKEEEENEEIAQFWDDRRLQLACRKGWYKSQIDGICFYFPMKVEGFFEGYSGPPWYMYGKDELMEPVLFSQGHPIKWVPTHSNQNKDYPKEITIKQGVFYDYKCTDDFDGEPFGLGIWDILIDWIWITDAINAFDQRLGNGFLLMVVPNNTDDTDILKYEKIVMRTRTEKGIVIKGAVDEPVEINWVGMAGMQVDFISHLEKLEDLISFNMGFPKRWIMGDAEGAMESSGKDHLEVNIQLKNIYSEWVNFIKRILIFHEEIDDFKDIVIKPPFELQLSEQEQIELNLMEAQIIGSKTWLTVNEQREEDGYDEIEGGDTLFESNAGADAPGGDINQESTSMMSTSVNAGSKKMQTSNKAKSDSVDVLMDIFTDGEISVPNLAKLCNISPNTVSKMRDKFDTMKKPKYKEDSLTMKFDSVCLGDDVYEIQDVPLVLPQSKYYKHLGYNSIRPREEIEKIFNDPTQPREFRIGATITDDHSSRVPLEILKKSSVGMIKFNRLDEEGNIRGNIRYDLKEADRILGNKNYIRDMTEKGENIPTSIALYSNDKPSEGGMVESNLDIRSFVFTKNPRNTKAGK